ncbi:MAG: cytidylyltransferase domain-containing protein [Waddliaceae bacterium]
MEDKDRKIVIIIQARMRSVRLPGKVMLKVLGRPLLSYLVERVRKVENADEVVIATTVSAEDQAIVEFCETHQHPVFRGNEEDVLDRYLQAARQYSADVIVRITADCPLIDPIVINNVIQFFLDHDYDYVSNMLTPTYPRGMDVEVFSIEVLEKTEKAAMKKSDREHVTLFMYRHPEIFRLANVPYKEDFSKYRFTVDTQEDYILIQRILEALCPTKRDFVFEDVLDLLKKNPGLAQINAHIQQKPIEEHEI